MINIRVMPCLLLKGLGLVKTVKFKEPKYIGDPRNAVKIFNEKEVDELVILDIMTTSDKKAPQFDLIHEIVTEAFMPVAYGGGIRKIEDARRIFAAGVEKIVIGAFAVETPSFISEAAAVFGSQSVLVCMDVKKSFLGKYEIYTHSGRKATGIVPVDFARKMEKMGAGELIVNSIDRDGTFSGYDIHLLKSVTSAVSIPVVACGGAGTILHFGEAVREGGASAVAAGSMFVLHGKHRAVLISYPDRALLEKEFCKL